jgi:hypothetical protein
MPSQEIPSHGKDSQGGEGGERRELVKKRRVVMEGGDGWDW